MAKQMRKVRVGSVVGTRMDKTAVVEMVWKQRHPIYQKQMRRVARFYVHDPESQCQIGDTVRIQETRPVSKTKHWRLLEILQRRQVAEVRPIELESDVEPVMTGEALMEEPEYRQAASDEEAATEGDSDEDEEDTQA
jgi:small subunit ribosomal protein S17